MAAKEEHTKRKGRSDFSKSNKKHKSKDENSNLSSSAQKRLVRKDRQSQRRHADTVTDAKVLWNKLRLKSNTAEETTALMEQVMKLIRGKAPEIALQHDASRIVQAAIQFGNDEQRKELLKEICESQWGLAELSKIQYAHFCSLKFIKYCARDEDSVKMIVKSFKGSMPKLAVHSVGSRVIESLFLNFPSKATVALKQEFYGPHFTLFAPNLSGTPTLKTCVEAAKTDTQKEGAINFVKEILSKGMTKSFFGFTYFQELFAEYVDIAEPNEMRTMASSVVDHSIHMLSTRAGARVVAACASYGSPKDRKRMCKNLKGYTSSSLLHRDAYLALTRLVQVTDDTVSVHKSILNEILAAPKNDAEEKGASPMLDLALSESGSKFFLALLVEDEATRMKYFDPYERSILGPQATIKENGVEVPTSKKDPQARRQELLKHMKGGLEEVCTNHADQLLVSVPGSRVLKEVYNSLSSKEVVDAVVAVCESALEEESDDKELSLFEHPVGHRAIKNLILSDEKREKALFSEAFVEKLGDSLKDVAKSNRGAFVVATLFKVPSVRKEVLAKLKPMKQELKQLSKEREASAGYGAIMKELSA